MVADQDNRSVLRLTLGLGGAVIILAGMYLMSDLVNQVLLAIVLTLLLVPLSEWLQNRGLSSVWANLLVVVLVLIAVVLLALFLIYSVAGLVTDLPVYEDGLDETKLQIQASLESLGINGEVAADAIASASKNILSIAASVAAGMVGYAVDAFFVILMFAFMLFDAGGFRARMQRAFASDHPTLSRIGKSTTAVTTYLRLLTFINLAIGVGDATLLWFLGIPNPALWGLVAFVTGYIPFIGFWIAIIPVLIIGYLQGGLTTAAIIFAGYWLINGTLSNIVAPRIYGQGLNLSPVVTLIAVLFWGVILGPVGSMVAVPLTAIISSVLLVSFPETEWFAILMREGDGAE